MAAGVKLKDTPAFQAHFLIGGKLGKASKILEIQVRKYFEPSVISGGLAEIFNEGVTLDEMQDYTEKLTKFKVKGDVSDNSGGSSGGNVYQSVLAISKSKKTATLIPLHYFKDFQLTATYQYLSGPSVP